MKKIIFTINFILLFTLTYAQDQNSSSRMIEDDSKLTIGGYGQIDYNQPMLSDVRKNGKLDVHRLVMLFGYKFNDRTNFVTELEFEHVKEVFVEQAFLNYKINRFINFRGGLLLTPMGIINQYHEPPTFNGVERPNVDNIIVPSTWREIGAGFAGAIPSASLKYELYVMNGFNGYDDKATFSGAKGLRSGRQKGAESYISSPSVSGRVDFYGINGLQAGVSYYGGKSQSTLYNNLDMNNSAAVATADSSAIGIHMLGADLRYSVSGLKLRGQFIYAALSNTEQYNKFGATDIGSALTGFYVEAGYNVLNTTTITDYELTPFVRYENYNTQAAVSGDLIANDAYAVQELVAGLGWKINNGAVIKLDWQAKKSKSDSQYAHTLNAGIGVWF